MLNKENMKKVAAAVLWNGASAAIVAIPTVTVFSMSALKAIGLIVATAFVNGVIVAAKKYVDERRALLESSKKPD